MPVLARVGKRLEKEAPLDGIRLAACLHVTAETANLMRVLATAGPRSALCAANPLSTQDDVAAALGEEMEVLGVAGEDLDTYAKHVGDARRRAGRRSPSTTVPTCSP